MNIKGAAGLWTGLLLRLDEQQNPNTEHMYGFGVWGLGFRE